MQFQNMMAKPYFTCSHNIIYFFSLKTISQGFEDIFGIDVLLEKAIRCTFSSPEADIFSCFFCHPTAIDDSGPNKSCIWKIESAKQTTIQRF